MADGTAERIAKLINLSKEEQRIRFLKRIDRPEKNWKFSRAEYPTVSPDNRQALVSARDELEAEAPKGAAADPYAAAQAAGRGRHAPS